MVVSAARRNLTLAGVVVARVDPDFDRLELIGRGKRYTSII